jgi:hypothetical protein
LFKIHFSITIPFTPRSPHVVPNHQVLWPKFCIHFSYLRCVLHAPPI